MNVHVTSVKSLKSSDYWEIQILQKHGHLLNSINQLYNFIHMHATGVYQGHQEGGGNWGNLPWALLC